MSDATTRVGKRGKPSSRSAEQRLSVLRRVHPSPLSPEDTLSLRTSMELTIGRSADLRSPLLGELRIADPGCSRLHARVIWDKTLAAFTVVDLDSANGTFVDGVRVEEPTPLRDGAVIRLGRTLFVMVQLTAPSNSVPAQFTPGVAIRRAIAEQQGSRLANADLNVMVTGETGVGKERLCAHLHERSGRSGRFVDLNCATLIGEERACADLFGWVRGAYTGAVGSGHGHFVAANGGTLFLDEIGELSAKVQAMLLRTLTEGTVRPFGGAGTPVRVSARVISATHQDLDQMVERGVFRQDLLARLREATLHLPPLRMRRDEILPLFRSFVPAELGLTVDAAEALLRSPWPDNVRGLKSAAKRAVAFAEDQITVHDLPEGLSRAPSSTPTPQRLGGPPSRAELLAVCRETGGNVAAIARTFGKGRQQIWRWLKRWEIEIDAFRG